MHDTVDEGGCLGVSGDGKGGGGTPERSMLQLACRGLDPVWIGYTVLPPHRLNAGITH